MEDPTGTEGARTDNPTDSQESPSGAPKSWADQVEEEVEVRKVEIPPKDTKTFPKGSDRAPSHQQSEKFQSPYPEPQLVTVEREALRNVIACVEELAYQSATLTVLSKDFKLSLSRQPSTSTVRTRKRRQKKSTAKDHQEAD